jgi:proteasome lid subunit RPN8/RPN11
MLNDRKLPVWCINQAHDFFGHIWNKQKTESSLYILYNRTTEKFRLFAPEQYTSSGHVDHKLENQKLPEDFAVVGTIHSHCNFSAFHSQTDIKDMQSIPGLHITIGHVDKDTPEMVFALSVGQQKFDVTRDSIIDEEDTVDHNGYNTMPPFWPTFVHKGQAPWATYTKKTYSSIKQQHQRSVTQVQHNWDSQAWGEWEDQQDWNQMSLTEMKADDDTDAFKKYKREIGIVEEEIEELTIWLNTFGFVMNYNIIDNPPRAQKQYDAIMEGGHR